MHLLIMENTGRLYRLQRDGWYSELRCPLTDTDPMDFNERNMGDMFVSIPDMAVDGYFCDPLTLEPMA